jgi:hypothetical protein
LIAPSTTWTAMTWSAAAPSRRPKKSWVWGGLPDTWHQQTLILDVLAFLSQVHFLLYITKKDYLYHTAITFSSFGLCSYCLPKIFVRK